MPPTLVMPLFLPNFDAVYGGWLGGVVYVQMLAKLLSALDESERPRIIVLTDAGMDSSTIAALWANDAVETVLTPDGKPLSFKPSIAAQITTSGQPDTDKINAILEGATTLFPVSRALFHTYKALHWIPDFQHKHLPEMFDAPEIEQREREIGIMLTARRFVLVSSEDAAADLRRFYPAARAKPYVWSFISGLDVDAAPAVDPRAAFGLPEKYLFAPNQFWKHKDHLTLFRAVAALNRAGHEITVVCTGTKGDARNPTHYQDLMKFVAESGMGERIIHLGLVSSADLMSLFRYCAAVVQPSLFEGWSTVVEDAKAIGRPIILSDLAVHREQANAPNPFFFYRRGEADALAQTIAAQWSGLRPGPDPYAEMTAALARKARARTTARGFLAIMHDMAAVTRAETGPTSQPRPQT